MRKILRRLGVATMLVLTLVLIPPGTGTLPAAADPPEYDTIEERKQALIDEVYDAGYPYDLYDFGRKEGGYAAMAQFAKGNITEGRNFVDYHLDRNRDMFWGMNVMEAYMMYGGSYTQALRDKVKSRIMSFEILNAEGTALSGTTPNHRLMYSAVGVTAHEQWPTEYPGNRYTIARNYLLTNTAVDATGINNTNPRLSYTNLAGNTLEIVYGTSRTINGANVNYADWPLLDNPWIHQDYDSPNLTLSHSGETLNYDFTNWTTSGSTDIIVDNSAAEFAGTWTTSTSLPNFYGANYHFRASGGTGSNWVKWRANLTTAGNYSVYYWLPNGSATRASNAQFTVWHDGANTTYTVNQQVPGGSWKLLGTHFMSTSPTGNGVVRLTDQGNNSYVIADAIKFVKQ